MRILSVGVLIAMVLTCSVEARPKRHRSHHHTKKASLDAWHVNDVFPDPNTDACSHVECPKGSECLVNRTTNLAECICRPYCKPHYKPVCGSDGVMYENHCELHRASCVSGQRITVHSHGCDTPQTAFVMTTTPEGPIPSMSPTEAPDTCTPEEMAQLKEELIAHYREQFHNPNEDNDLPPLNKKYIVSLILNHYDIDADDAISRQEMESAMTLDRITDLLPGCSFLDVLDSGDFDGNEKLSGMELYREFNIKAVSLSGSIAQRVTVAKVGDNLALPCELSSDHPLEIRWTRNNAPLTEIQEYQGIGFYAGDTSLYLTAITLMHEGSYACYAEGYEEVKQTHLLQVQVPPSVKICPHSQLRKQGSKARVQCHAEGIPTPQKSWTRNDIPLVQSDRIEMQNKNSSVLVKEISYPDTGIYTCTATNPLSEAHQSASVFIQPQDHPLSPGPLHVFYLFHRDGIQTFEPDTCGFRLALTGASTLPDTIKTLCSVDQVSETRRCDWGDAVSVDDRYIYASQPYENRVVVLDARSQRIIEVISTDGQPVSLQYVEHVDSLWVLCRRSEEEAKAGRQSIMVIKSAGQPGPHHTIHTEPVGHTFELVEGLFIPREQIPKQGTMNFGYIVHHNQLGLHKIDLVRMERVALIDLTAYNCHPEALNFVAIGGSVVINCAGSETVPAKQLVLDYLTDSVIKVNEGIRGRPYVSPDGRYIISVDANHQYVHVQKVLSESGKIKTAFEVKTNLRISDVGFFPSKTSHTYDVFATSRDQPDVLFIDLESGFVKTITGVQTPIDDEDWPWDSRNRRIVNSGFFDPYLVTPAANHEIVINGLLRKVHCDIEDIAVANVIVWIGKC
ncbi:follistatin-related protein 5 [Strongylocentrotus purpuratus]|uniref:Follistatin-related protein 5 n=1 Tax=Strongylocentrotus purpuratus TaxID=7668 RepID=A0A7M7NI27_STRPU|nr:follistatin-related protein 5 [Strongylocentrotus purpuratus]